MRVLLLGLGMMLWGAMSAAQPLPCRLQVYGQARGADGNPLPAATVDAIGTGKGATADAEGHFLLKGLCPGQYTLEVRFTGLQPRRQRILVQANTELSFTLLPDSTERPEVLILGLPTPKSEPATTLQGQALLATRGQSLGQALSVIPGVSILQTGPTVAKPVLHGMSGSRLLILNNGIRHEAQQWGAEHAPEIDPFLATQLTVVRGAASIRYGADAIAGVVLVQPPALPDSAGAFGGEINLAAFTNGRMGVGSVQLQGALAGVPGLAWRIQGSLKNGGDLRAPDYWLNNTSQRERNFSGALGYHRGNWAVESFYSQFDNQVGIIRWAHPGNRDDAFRYAANGGPFPADTGPFSRDLVGPWQDIEHHLSKTHVRWQGPWATWQLIYAYQRNYRAEYDRHRFRIVNGQFVNTPESTPAMTFTLRTHTADLIAGHTSTHWTWESGLQVLYQDNNYGGAELIPFFRQRALGGYAMLRRIQEQWTVEGALRYDVRRLDDLWSQSRGNLGRNHDYQGASGNLGAAWTSTSGWQVRLQAASHWRAPNVNELYSRGVHHGTASYEYGDTSLVPERAYSLVATLETPRNRRWHLSISPYLKRIDNFIQLVSPGRDTLRVGDRVFPPVVRTIRGFFPAFYYRAVDVNVYGVDVSADWSPWDRWQVRATGSLVRMRDLGRDAWLPFAPADRAQFSLRHTLIDGKRRSNTYIEWQTLLVDRQWRYDPAFDFWPPPPGYVRHDLTLNTTLRWAGMPFTWQVAVTNLLNTSYREYLDRLRYYAVVPGIGAVIRLQVQI